METGKNIYVLVVVEQNSTFIKTTFVNKGPLSKTIIQETSTQRTILEVRLVSIIEKFCCFEHS